MTSYKCWQFVKVLTNLNSVFQNSVTFLTNSHVPSNAICSVCADIETTFLSLVQLLTFSIFKL